MTRDSIIGRLDAIAGLIQAGNLHNVATQVQFLREDIAARGVTCDPCPHVKAIVSCEPAALKACHRAPTLADVMAAIPPGGSVTLFGPDPETEDY